MSNSQQTALTAEWYPAIKNTSTAKSRILAVLKAAIKTYLFAMRKQVSSSFFKSHSFSKQLLKIVFFLKPSENIQSLTCILFY